jgi:5-methylcytosine-specific restriction protein A
VVYFDDLSFSNPLKKSRKETYLGLTKSIEELGILTPIHVMVTETYSDWLSEEHEKGEEFDGFKYVVIDGFRRVYGGVKNGLKRCNAIIWDFKDKDLGNKLLTPLSLILNRNQKHSWTEIWGLYQILEMQSAFTPSTLEYLLQLELGDAMRLKDIMLCDYDDVKKELLEGKKTLLQCYNMLQKYRKDEDQILNDDKKGISEVEDGEEIINKEPEESKVLSDQEVHEILEMDDTFNGELSEDDFNELAGTDVPDEGQKVGDRHPLDPKLRAAVLTRDGYCCQASGMGKELPIELALSILHVHHLVPVHCGGKDILDNLITLDLSSHTLVHVIERNNGKLGMSKEEFDGLPKDRQEYLKKVMQIARYAVEANRRVGRSREEIKKDADASSRFKMPGIEQHENMSALKEAGESPK